MLSHAFSASSTLFCASLFPVTLGFLLALKAKDTVLGTLVHLCLQCIGIRMPHGSASFVSVSTCQGVLFLTTIKLLFHSPYSSYTLTTLVLPYFSPCFSPSDIRILDTIEPRTTRGLGAPTCHAFENPHITSDSSKT